MTLQPNGTDAKDIATKFFELTNTRATSSIFGKTIAQVKNIMANGYTKQEILEAMEYIIVVKQVQMYSIGYISASINDVLREIKEIREKLETEERVKKLREQLASSENLPKSEVNANDESTQRNREKAERDRANLQSRLGKKFNFDMFEGQ